MAQIDIRGDIIGNDDKWIYDWLDWESTCPADIRAVLDTTSDETVDVYINSRGGMVMAGQEIYSALRADPRVRIHVDGMACSAASLIAMAGQSDISPASMLMVHNVAVMAAGDYHEMDKASRTLREMNKAIASAFVVKSGKSEEEILKLMDKETWLTANTCVEMGLIDGITEAGALEEKAAAAFGGIRLTDEIRQKVEAEAAAAKQAADDLESTRKEILADLDSYGV